MLVHERGVDGRSKPTVFMRTDDPRHAAREVNEECIITWGRECVGAAGPHARKHRRVEKREISNRVVKTMRQAAE